MINIAILSASRQVTLVKHFRRALRDSGGGKVFCLDVELDRAAMIYADSAFVCPYVNSSEYDDFIINFCKKNNIDLLISCRDGDLLKLCELKQTLQNSGTKVMISDYRTIQTCLDKRKFNYFCLDNGFKVPKTYSLDANLQEIVFPVFLKPINGSGSKNVFKVNSEQELDFILRKCEEEFIVQEFISDREFSIDLFTDFQGNVISVVPRERILTVGGESYIGKTFKNDTLIKESIDLSNKLGLIGHNTLQCFFDGDEIKWIEVNPRFGGAANLGFESGHKTPEYLVSLVKGEKLSPKIGDFQDGLQMFRFTNDVFKITSDVKTENRIFCVDIDGTICTENCHYEDAEPINKVIDKVNELFENNTIILFTARGSSSGFDWKPLTERQLKKWGVKYHSLLMGKPFADYYIDNKAIDVLDWV